MDDMKCSVLPAQAIDQAAKVMAEAFANSPSYTFIFRGTVEHRRGALEWLFRRNLGLIHIRCPDAFRGMLDKDGQVIACFLWTPSSHKKLSTWDMLKAGLWQMPFLFGISTVQRLLTIMDNFEETEKDAFPKDENDFIMLERMAVHPDFQGRGLGSKCLKSVLSEATASKVRLVTQESRNVTFYKRLGFRVVAEADQFENEKEYTYHNWYMSLDSGSDAQATNGNP